MSEKHYYVSWVDKRTDPWPQWENLQPGKSGAIAGGQLQFLPAEHGEWPGIPYLPSVQTLTVADARMGMFVLPGIPFEVDGKPARLYTGPTLSALFHPASRFFNLKGLDRVYILFQPELKDSPHETFKGVLTRLGQARSIPDFVSRVKFVPIPGITDPTDHELIIKSIEKWLKKDDPFNFGARHAGKTTTRITINLSPGTPSMHASWLLLRWNGALGKPQCIIEYVQGDGGLRTLEDGALRDPLKLVPIDILSQWMGQMKPPPQEFAARTDTGVLLEDLKGPPFDELRQKLEHAALLGLPVLLQGERGTGKTYLARFYHERRQFYRRERGVGDLAGPERKEGKEKKVRVERLPDRVGDNNFVTVTLSEYADVETLRDTLFGWAKNAWNLAFEAYDGLLGEAHGGTLFLDEIHHLDKALQAALLGPLNNRRYRPKMATYEIISHFDLVVATNDPNWRTKMADDFRDRVERIVLDIPSFRSFQRYGTENLWKFWEFTLLRRCEECRIPHEEEGAGWKECRDLLLGVFKSHPLQGNWRDLQRLADNVLLHLTQARDGRPSPLRWDKEQLEHAIDETFGNG